MLVLYLRKDNQRRVQLNRSKQRKERVKLLLARCTDPDKENSNPDIHILLFQLVTDASKEGFGASLEQKQPDGKIRPLLYISRTTLPSEKNWDT